MISTRMKKRIIDEKKNLTESPVFCYFIGPSSHPSNFRVAFLKKIL
jgi:hypothetical protein